MAARAKDEFGAYRPSIFFEHIKDQHFANRIHIFYQLLYKLGMALTLILMEGHQYFQCMSILVICTFNAFQSFIVNPYLTPLTNIQETVNEFMILLFCHLNYSFLYENENQERGTDFKFTLGWLIIAQSTFSIIFNLVIIAYLSITILLFEVLIPNLSNIRSKVRMALRSRNKRKLLKLYPQQKFGQIEHQLKEFEAYKFCKEWVKQRIWCQENGLDVTLLEEEVKFRRLISEMKFDQKFKVIEHRKKVINFFAQVGQLKVK